MSRGPQSGIKFWERRTKHGRDKAYTPETLWAAACEYFTYCIENPLMSVEYVNGGKRVNVPKMRAMTWSGLELYLDFYSFREYKTKDSHKKFRPIIKKIDNVMYTQKFEGAAAGLLNSAIIARDLSLKEKLEHTGADGNAIEIKNITGIEVK